MGSSSDSTAEKERHAQFALQVPNVSRSALWTYIPTAPRLFTQPHSHAWLREEVAVAEQVIDLFKHHTDLIDYYGITNHDSTVMAGDAGLFHPLHPTPHTTERSEQE